MSPARILLLVAALSACHSSEKKKPPDQKPVNLTPEVLESLTPEQKSALLGWPMPHASPGPMASAAPMPAPGPKDLADTLVADGRFNTIVSLARAASVLNTIKSMGPFTLLVPTDDAFKKASPAAVQSLLADPKRLDTLLRGMAIPSQRIASKSFTPGLKVKTSQEKLLVVTERNGKILVSGAHIVVPDLVASNGIIHGIDKVPGL